ncbi:efflux RND transporter periplasmic adaptor subunit [Flavimarina sp. Hel_I_48]|uniref:efflux RND transporter periplasmic adaptor subunit n=1 Tax=Flavimarina sp. Hel_I_48 TaxID=1392488 RepID=UPI0004DECF98|nr:HlyD family efflux transporter periplasmic adaptor subunit [Flavimarina sp. Hel_I_48]
MRLLNSMGFIPLLSIMLLFMVSCNDGNGTPPLSVKAAIDVRAATVEVTNIKEYREYNGVTQYQKKENLRSQVTGYVTYLPYGRGAGIRRGATFATLHTKEQAALADAVSIDSSLAQFTKPLRITSNASGTLTQLNVVKGDYVAEGDILAVITQPETLVVKVNVPFDQKKGMALGTRCQVILPEGASVDARVTGMLPVIDSVDQTQTFLIAMPNANLPEGLNVNVRTIVKQDSTALAVPQQALQTNELMTDFWVMKIVDDSLATKQEVIPLLQNDSVVQIKSSNVKLGDRVVTEGSYQMQDSTKVKIMRQ